LARIFHDIYLTNAYVGHERINIDSLNIYEPVFAAYGYTSEDVQSPIGTFAKRKSARLSDGVEAASGMLRSESRYYRRRVEIRDTIALVARKRYAETVYSDSLIRVRRIGDTGRLRIVIPDIRRGSYEVSYNYFLDSLDRNTGLRTSVWLVDSTGRQSGSNQRRLTQMHRTNITVTLDAATDAQRYLVLALNGYPENLTTPNLTIDSLRVTYYLPDELATERLARSWMDSIVGSSPFFPHETHLGTPLVDSLRP
jgi:hypothetical protein